MIATASISMSPPLGSAATWECIIIASKMIAYNTIHLHNTTLIAHNVLECAADLEGCPGGLVVLEEVAVDAVDCAELRDVLHQHRGLHQPSAVTLSGGGKEGSQLGHSIIYHVCCLMYCARSQAKHDSALMTSLYPPPAASSTSPMFLSACSA